MYVLQLMDSYVASYGLLMCGVVESIVLCWVYGTHRLFDNIEEMIGFRPGRVIYFTMKFVAPCLIVAIVVVQFAGFKRLTYSNYKYPLWADILGWCFVAFEMALIPGVAIYKVVTTKEKLPIMERIKKLSRPTDDWGKRMNQPGNSANISVKPHVSSNQVEAIDNRVSEEADRTLPSPDLVGLEASISSN
ncbi:Sodium- and chloride-dependent GABA transporter 2 [Lamellibrachia satsuma]|nr:Sodium- and chloride-dependent GABA transporter 2 [Lamellibrachia satsuma]